MPLRNGALICYTNKATATVLISDADWPFPSFLYQDHLYALPTSPSDITAKLNQALARVESLERHIRNAKDRERKAKSIVHALLEDLRQKTLINEELKERLDLCSGEYSTFFDQWADLCRSFDCSIVVSPGDKVLETVVDVMPTTKTSVCLYILILIHLLLWWCS